MLISFAVTAKLICIFVFAYAESRFSHDEAHIISFIMEIYLSFHADLCLTCKVTIAHVKGPKT